jgi:hypothetical protein
MDRFMGSSSFGRKQVEDGTRYFAASPEQGPGKLIVLRMPLGTPFRSPSALTASHWPRMQAQYRLAARTACFNCFSSRSIWAFLRRSSAHWVQLCDSMRVSRRQAAS